MERGEMNVSGGGELERGVEWEETGCLLCGGRRGRTVVVVAPEGGAERPGRRPAVVRCGGCGLCYTSPRPTPESMDRFYPADYGPHEVRPVAEASRRRKWRPRRSALRLPARREVPWHGEGRLLDFGCGGGAFLERMHRRGWRVMGVDASETVVRRIEEELGLAALAGDLSAPGLAASSFDVITMRQSLEHVHRPLETLQRAFRLLAGGGKLMVWVPNIEGLPFGWFGPAWYGLDLPRHLVHFTPSTLRRMVGEAGFRVDRIWMVSHPSWLRRSAARARQQGIGTRGSWWLARRPAARWAAWYAALRGRSDCIGLSATKRGW